MPAVSGNSNRSLSGKIRDCLSSYSLRSSIVFLFGSHFGWHVSPFQVQGVTSIWLHLSFVGTATFNAFELSGTSHEAPAPGGLVGHTFDGSLAHDSHGELFAIF